MMENRDGGHGKVTFDILEPSAFYINTAYVWSLKHFVFVFVFVSVLCCPGFEEASEGAEEGEREEEEEAEVGKQARSNGGGGDVEQC